MISRRFFCFLYLCFRWVGTRSIKRCHFYIIVVLLMSNYTCAILPSACNRLKCKIYSFGNWESPTFTFSHPGQFLTVSYPGDRLGRMCLLSKWTPLAFSRHRWRCLWQGKMTLTAPLCWGSALTARRLTEVLKFLKRKGRWLVVGIQY